jgi:hypothetical protein
MRIVRKRPAARWARRCALGVAAAASGIFLGGIADAQIAEHLSSSSSYTYDFVPGLPGVNSGTSDSKSFDLGGSNPNLSTNIQMNYGTLVASDASFFFFITFNARATARSE